MNEQIMKEMFPEEIIAVKAGKCPFCKEEVNIKDFRDSLSQKEFKISGICQRCQDDFFV